MFYCHKYQLTPIQKTKKATTILLNWNVNNPDIGLVIRNTEIILHHYVFYNIYCVDTESNISHSLNKGFDMYLPKNILKNLY